MFNVEFLHVIREFEYCRILEQLPKAARILEIGGGTGYQARRLQQAGFDVVSIDLADSIYSDKLVFPVQPYDGRTFPFADQSFDVVFSSNVLEHVPDLPRLHAESLRVLRPGGFCLHVMPTGAWRFWTNLAHYVELLQRLALASPRLVPRGFDAPARRRVRNAAAEMFNAAKHYRIVPRHGEVGNAFSEIRTFGVRHWLRHFRGQGLTIRGHAPLHLFYTGHMVLGARLPVGLRAPLSRLLGSACHAYRVSAGK
ncbi:MAG TPA: class I SAM-dependent methyltransferase [Rhodocyclaceae bacterium]|nr:class I SAM-dependent methyltransferase [Rhodocyclaceae bacterium]